MTQDFALGTRQLLGKRGRGEPAYEPLALRAQSGQHRGGEDLSERGHVVGRGEAAKREEIRRQQRGFIEHVEDVAQLGRRRLAAELDDDAGDLSRSERHQHSHAFAYAACE